MEDELKHMIEGHCTEVEKEFTKSDLYGEVTIEINKSLRQGNVMTVDWNKVIRDNAIIAAEYALEDHDGDFKHEPDQERGER
jgi:hypothetical protein